MDTLGVSSEEIDHEVQVTYLRWFTSCFKKKFKRMIKRRGKKTQYTVSVSAMAQTLTRLFRGALIDRGANGGIIGSDAVVIKVHHRKVDVTGIDNHELNSLKIVDASAKVMSNRGWVIVIMPQYAYHGV